MLTLTTFCTPASVRAILGVSDDELEDFTILDPIYAVQLGERLTDINASITSVFLGLTAPANPNQERFVDLVGTFAAYVVAQQLAGSVKMFAPQSITDSKSGAVRISDPYSDLRVSILGTLTYLTERILKTYALLYPAISVPALTQRVFAASVGIAKDPVTNV